MIQVRQKRSSSGRDFLVRIFFRRVSPPREKTNGAANSESEVAAQWDRNAGVWTDQVRKRFDIFREHWNNPAFLDFAGDLNGKTVLDAGCGEGHNTRIFARRGARMTGVDLSPRMLEFAREEERYEPLGIRYERASYTDLAMFNDETFDAAISTMAFMDGPDFPAAMREVARVIASGRDARVQHPAPVLR